MLVSLDLETHLIKPGDMAPKPIVAAVKTGVAEPSLFYPDEAADFLKSRLANSKVTIVGANTPYDMAVMGFHYPDLMPLIFQAYEDGRIICVQTLQRLIDISHGCLSRPRYDGSTGYSLADLTWHYLGKDRSEEKSDPQGWRLRYGELEDLPFEKWPLGARDYALADAVDASDVYQAQRTKYGILPSETEQYRAHWALHLMTVQGIIVDQDRVSALKMRLLKDRADYRACSIQDGLLKLTPCAADEEPDALVPYKRDPTKTRRMRWGRDMKVIKWRVEQCFKHQGKSVPLTEGGNTSTDGDTLRLSKDPGLILLADAGITEKLLSTYIPALEQGKDGPINTRFNVLVNNGRTSSHADKRTKRGFNFQNFPRSNELDPNAAVNFVRACIVPRPGNYFCSVDLDGGELRSLAQVLLWLFGKSKLADVLNAGRDPLLVFAAYLLEITYDEAKRRKASGDGEVKRARQFSKVFLYGKPGGLGITSLIDFARTNYDVVMDEATARRLDSLYFKAYPEMRRYFDYVSKLVGAGDARLKSFGSGMLRGGVGYTDGCNHFFSNLVSQGVKDACFYVAWECYVDLGTSLYGSRPVAMIHDEILKETPIARAHLASMRLAELVVMHTQKRMPDVKVTASPALMTSWEKDAEPVYDETTGELVPWTRKHTT